MTGTSYYFCYNGIIYKASNALPVLEPANAGDACGYASYSDALSILHEYQNIQSKNTLGLDERILEVQRRILERVEILSNNHMAVYAFLNS